MDRGGAARLQGACLETALAIGLTLPRTVVGLEDVSPDAPPQGDSLWIPPVHNVCGRLQGREAGRGPTSWGTLAQMSLFCNRGGAFPGRMVLLWPAPSYSRGTGLACAAIPPAPPSNVFGNRGTRCTPGGGCAPCTPLGGGDAIEGGATLCNSTITCRYGGLGAAKLSTVICLA